MAFPKGKPRPEGAGRKKGQPNRTTTELKAAIMSCFDLKAFQKWAKDNPDLFYTRMVQPLIPKEVDAKGFIELVIRDCVKQDGT